MCLWCIVGTYFHFTDNLAPCSGVKPIFPRSTQIPVCRLPSRIHVYEAHSSPIPVTPVARNLSERWPHVTVPALCTNHLSPLPLFSLELSPLLLQLLPESVAVCSAWHCTARPLQRTDPFCPLRSPKGGATSGSSDRHVVCNKWLHVREHYCGWHDVGNVPRTQQRSVAKRNECFVTLTGRRSHTPVQFWSTSVCTLCPVNTVSPCKEAAMAYTNYHSELYIIPIRVLKDYLHLCSKLTNANS